MEKTLSSKDICAIVKSCADNGVKSLKIGDLHILLGTEEKSSSTPVQTIHYIPEANTGNPQSSNQEDEIQESQDDYINDPAQWERRQLEEKK